MMTKGQRKNQVNRIYHEAQQVVGTTTPRERSLVAQYVHRAFRVMDEAHEVWLDDLTEEVMNIYVLPEDQRPMVAKVVAKLVFDCWQPVEPEQEQPAPAIRINNHTKLPHSAHSFRLL